MLLIKSPTDGPCHKKTIDSQSIHRIFAASTPKEMFMKMKLIILAMLLSLLFIASGCDKDKPNDPEGLSTAEALSNYWMYQTDLTAAMEARDGTMAQITQKINALGSNKNYKDAIAEIDALVETYAAQSEAVATRFRQLAQAENSIIEYGGNKGLLTSLAKGVYNKAADAAVSSYRMVRSGWRVMSGRQSLRQVLVDPESGIPIVSNFAEKVQKRNTARDGLVREAILNWNPLTSPVDTNYEVPYDQLPGSTPLEKANAYANLSDEDPMKMQTRRGVMNWVSEERMATAETAVELGETGVKIVGDAYGGGAGEWTNEVLNQHMEEHQTQTQTGNLNVQVNQDGGSNPPIIGNKTLIISKANMPEGDPRITVIMNAPQALQQPLPTGQYNVIALADGFIRNVYQNLQIVQGQATNVLAKLLNLAENPIIIESLEVSNGSITVGESVSAHVSCVSTIGKTLSFSWTVSGGGFNSATPNGTDFSFVPTEEKEYTISVTVTDDAGNSKTKSVVVASLGGKLAIDDWEIAGESFADGKLNPGETATLRLFVSNTGEAALSGTQVVSCGAGVTVNFSPNQASIGVGQTLQVDVPVTLSNNYSESNVPLLYSLNTQNANQIPTVLSDQEEIPVDFYVSINPIVNLVTQRKISIVGRIANPLLTTAVLVLDNDLEHAFDLNLTNGYFSQEIVLSGSTVEVQRSVRVIAVSGSLTAEDTIYFNSLVPPMALRATLTWNTNGTDVDFWITDPNGEKCYYANRTTSSGLTLDTDDTNGYGPENITTESIIPGDYLVQVHYYSDHDSENAIGSDCVVVIRQDENSNQPPVNYYGYLGDSGDIWNVTTLHYDPARGWSIKPLNTHNRVQPSSLPAK